MRELQRNNYIPNKWFIHKHNIYKQGESIEQAIAPTGWSATWYRAAELNDPVTLATQEIGLSLN